MFSVRCWTFICLSEALRPLAVGPPISDILTARFAQDAKDAKKIFFVESRNCQPYKAKWQFTIRQNLRPFG